MQTRLPDNFLATEQGKIANKILRSCVHCGFCTATCPTYQLLGDELDSPRGRIYLIKQMLEGNDVSRRTQIHLDRCLTCRACETTCPSGVEYGKLIDLGRNWIEPRVSRPITEKTSRWILRKLIPYPGRFKLLLQIARLFMPLLPAHLAHKIPARPKQTTWPDRQHKHKVLILNGCAQSVTHPEIDAATARVLDYFQIEIVQESQSGCCGAVSQHLSAAQEAKKQMQKNIDAWWPQINNSVKNIIVNASGCAVQLKEYAHYFEDDPNYKEKAQLIANNVIDISELLAQLPLEKAVNHSSNQTIAFHSPCTLQHGQQITNVIEPMLEKCGYNLTHIKDSHLCCGSAGTYSILQADLSSQLLENKLTNLTAENPEIIATANIGCLMQLQTTSPVPVVHWINLIDKAIQQKT
ncbi:MAG: glycolate oxidase subunit GlcF [Gammaproteobacteria bacterium]|nr:glycolate oxidase subunit GlcF [Gammaproteobacteria bacterium]